MSISLTLDKRFMGCTLLTATRKLACGANCAVAGRPSEIQQLGKVCFKCDSRKALTLVELLIVLSLILILAGIALPTAKELLSDQKLTRSAQKIASYISQARSEAIAKGVHAGVRIERLAVSEDVVYQSAASARIYRTIAIPDYAGESTDAAVEFMGITTGIANVRFKESDNLLLSLYNQEDAPIKTGDLIELPGGRSFPIVFTDIVEDPPLSGVRYVRAQIDLNTPEDPTNALSTETFPLGHRISGTGRYPYRIRRRPEISKSNPLTLSPGVAIDLNYSGIGIGENQFVPGPQTLPNVNSPIDILFGPDGRVDFISVDNVGTLGSASGLIFLCLGTTDGVVEPLDERVSASNEELFQNDGQLRANITNPDSIWIVINPNSGRVVAAPFASVSGTPATTSEGLIEARSLALLADTLETTP